jgi:hypothetical protein
MTGERFFAMDLPPALKDGFFVLRVAFCAEAVLWLAVCHRWLQGQNKNAWWQFLELVTLLLIFSRFENIYLFFELRYAAQKGESFIMRCKRAVVRFNDFGLEFD